MVNRRTPWFVAALLLLLVLLAAGCSTSTNGTVEEHVAVARQKDTGPPNLALGKPTYQSSTAEPMGASSHAVDGNTDADSDDGSVASIDDQDPWWYVDLGSSQPIGTVVVWPCNERGVGDFVVGVSNDLVDWTEELHIVSDDQLDSIDPVSFNLVNLSARYVIRFARSSRRVRSQVAKSFTPSMAREVSTTCSMLPVSMSSRMISRVAARSPSLTSARMRA